MDLTSENGNGSVRNKITNVEYSFPITSFHDRVIYFLDCCPIEDMDKYQQARKSLAEDIRGNYFFYEGLKGRFQEFLRKLAEVRPDKIREFTEGPWNDVGIDLLQRSFAIIAEDFYKTLYELLIELQLKLNKRLHKGAPLHQIGIINLGLGKFNKAKRYFQLGVIEDIIEDIIDDYEHYKGRPGFVVLRNELQVPESEIDALAHKTQGLIKSKIKESEIFYPERFLLEFKLDKKIIKVRDTDRQLFEVNTSYAKELLEKANVSKLTRSKKGEALEKLVAYLFSSIDGIEVKLNEKTKDSQLDLVIQNSIKSDPLYDVFGKFILIECKNWEDKVGVQEVKNFVSNVRFSYCNCGILLAKNGITGNSKKDKRDAELTILKEFHQDNIMIIVLTNTDLEAVVNGKSNLLSILLEKYEAIKLDK